MPKFKNLLWIASAWEAEFARNKRLHGAKIQSFGDHRIAMAFAIAALRAEDETALRHSECVAISYPGFFQDLERLVER